MNPHPIPQLKADPPQTTLRTKLCPYLRGHQGSGEQPLSAWAVLRPIAWVVITALGLQTVSPVVSAMQLPEHGARSASAPSAADRYAQTLQTLVEPLRQKAQAKAHAQGDQTKAAALQNSPAWPGNASIDYAGVAQKLQQDYEGIQRANQDLLERWQNAGIDPHILSRQTDISQQLATQHTQLNHLLQQAASAAAEAKDAERGNLLGKLFQPSSAPGTSANNKPALLQAQAQTQTQTQLQDFLLKNAAQPSHHTINLRNLPWQVESVKKAQPAVTEAELQQRLAPSLAAKTQATASAYSTQAMTAPGSSDLAATVEAQQTPEIKALATSLGHNPHRIYQWVHDNIHYTPTWGSVQGAQDTLDKKRGNAFDTNSLLISLLRASGIPARYVYGTIELPVAQVQNWVGGALTADAAQQILGQGGVPNVALVSGGKVSSIRMEHAWVEAYVRYYPGQGAQHIGGTTQGDTWVPLDASYKQYTFQPGMDLQSAVPLDAQALLDAASQGSQSNAQEGWVRNLNTTALQSQLNAYQNQLKTYIDSQNGGKSTVGDVLGTRNASIDPLPYLAGTLPYAIKARTQQFSEVPDSLRTQFRYQIYGDQRSAAWGDSPLLSWQTPTASLAGKKVTMAWVAASPADQAAIEALIPTPPPGQDLDPSQLPKGLPGSIRLKPEIRVDGSTVATGPAMSAGSEPVGAGAFTRYGSQGQDWDETQDQLIAGQQTALGVSIQGISLAQMEALKTRMEATQQKLQQAQAAPQDQRATILAGMTGENLTGDLLTATVWGYFASLQSHGAIASSQAQTFDLPALSYGLLHAQVKPNKLYGIVTTGISFQGLNMDIGHLRHIRWVKDDNPGSAINNKPELTQNGKSAAQNRWIAYNKMRGQYASAMEHAVPEQYWVDKSQCRYVDENNILQNPGKEDCTQGISAVKAIAIAQSQGQKIYTINQSNRDTALPKLGLGGEAGAEIRNAIEAGKEVTFHESPISAHGWTGYGYTITDPETGTGAYIIEGKGNGGEYNDNVISRAMQLNGLESFRNQSNAIDSNSKYVGLTKNAIGYAGLAAGTFFSCNADLIVNLIVLSIVLAIIANMAAKGGALAPAAIIVGLLVLASIPSSAMAAKENENCYLDCKKASDAILKITMPESIYGREHEVKTEYGAIPNSSFDICACRDGGIVIWQVKSG